MGLKRLCIFLWYSHAPIKSLMPGHLWLDRVDVVITTKCNRMCKGCNHMMPYYKHPSHVNKDLVITSMHKLNKAVDWVYNYNIMGGEPFLNPDLKFFLEKLPTEKCDVPQVITNAMIIPNDPELFDIMRKKKIRVLISDYPDSRQTQKKVAEILKREGIDLKVTSGNWTDYGAPINHNRSKKELDKQFKRCPVDCKNLLNGKLYYCFRSSHSNDLNICKSTKDEVVDLLGNSTFENRRQIRRLMWRQKPVGACQFCLRGTEENRAILRGERAEKI